MTTDQFVYWLMGFINKLDVDDKYTPLNGLKTDQWKQIIKALSQVEFKTK